MTKYTPTGKPISLLPSRKELDHVGWYGVLTIAFWAIVLFMCCPALTAAF